MTPSYNSETQRLVQNVILKLEKINMVFVKPVIVKHPRRTDKISKTRHGYGCHTYSTAQKYDARARTSFCVRKPGNFLRQIADACACVLRTARTSLRLVSFNSKNFFAVRLSKRKNFFASQRFNRARDRTLL